MAEDSNKDSISGGNAAQKAIELLQEASMLLSSASPVQSVGPSQSTTSTSPLATTAPSAVQRLRTIFAPYPRTSVSPASAYQRAQRPKTTSYKPYYAIKDTWTHEFFCLSEKNQSKVPSRSDKIQLQNCGLGRKKICLSSKADHSLVEEKLIQVYPKLSEAGGFQILRTVTGSGANSSSLVVIQPSPLGYSVPFLRDSSGLGQALAYIRPLQRNLSKNVSQEVRSIFKFWFHTHMNTMYGI